MADFLIDTTDEVTGAPSASDRSHSGGKAAPPRAQVVEQSKANPPEVAHWDLPVRAAIILGLAALSWAVIGVGVFLLLRR